MIRFIFNLGVRLATFVAFAAAFFRPPEAGLRARNRPCGSVVPFPCHSAAELRGRGMFSPAGRARDLAQAIDDTRNYRQNRADFGAEIEIIPDLRERGPPPRSEHAEPEDAVDPGRSRPSSPPRREGETLRLGRCRRVDHPPDLGD